MKKIIHPFLRICIRITSYFFFEKIEVSGMENLPSDCPVIFACNHPNSFLDSIVMTTCAKRSFYYTARGDFFKSKIASTLLHYIQILPVFRREEGMENLYKNEETFQYCIDVLKKNGAVSIFSEGISENEWDLRPLRKGTARLAFEAWNNQEIGNRLKIVPVAIHYSSWLKICPRIYIEFLENIERTSFSTLSESGLFNKEFNERLKNILSQKCIVIDKSNDTSLQNKLVGFILENIANGATYGKKIQDKYNLSGNENFKTNYKSLSEYISKENINYYKDSGTGIVSFIFSSLAFSFAYVLNALPYRLSTFIVWKSTKGNAFYDSLLYCALWLIYSAYLIILFSIIAICSNVWVGVSVVLLSIISASLYETSKRNIFCFLKRNKLKNIRQMLTQLSEISNG